METNMVAEPGTMPGGSGGVDLGGVAQPGIVPPPGIATVGMPMPLGDPATLGTQAAGIQTPVQPEEDEDDFEPD